MCTYMHIIVCVHVSKVLDKYKVILYIDGFIVKIQRPDHAGDAYFCGRHGKSCDSINVQYVTDQHGKVRHIITGLSGSTHDKTAASWSAELLNFLNNLPQNYVVLGDPAYKGLHPRVVTTFTGLNLNPDQKSFNDACTRIRQVGISMH
jgi:DDE superfamily endonuclease